MAEDELTIPQSKDRIPEYLRDHEGRLVTADHPSEKWGEQALHQQKMLGIYTLVIAVGVALLVVAKAAEVATVYTAIPVSVTVISNSKMEISYQSTQLNITNADVERGYIEVPNALRFSVNTNSRSGYLMDFHPIGHTFESVQIGGLGTSIQLGADGGTIVQRGMFPKRLGYELSFRFTLPAGIHAGSYPWPLQLSVRSLS